MSREGREWRRFQARRLGECCWKQRDIARALGITEGAVSHWRVTSCLLLTLVASGCASVAAILPGKADGTRQLVSSAAPSRITIQAGETIEQAFHRLGQIDQSIYIVVAGGAMLMTGESAPIGNLTDLTVYLKAYGLAAQAESSINGSRSDRSFPEVIDTLPAGSHYAWSAKGSVPKVRISSNSVKGTLAKRLPQLLGQTNAPYSVKDCEVIIGI